MTPAKSEHYPTNKDVPWGPPKCADKKALMRKDPQSQESSAIRQRRRSAYMVNAVTSSSLRLTLKPAQYSDAFVRASKVPTTYILRIRWIADHPTATAIDRTIVGQTGMNNEN